MNQLITKLVLRAARPYVTGPALADAMRAAREAQARGHAVTLSYWHDDGAPAAEVVAHYRASMAALSEAGIDGHIALKVPAFHDEPALVGEVLAEARARGITVVIDAHAPEQAAEDYAVAAANAPDKLGIAIPGRWKTSPDLADRAVAMGLRVRVVKGQWADPADPDIDLVDGYLRVIDRLAGRCGAVGVATHDARLAAEALRRLAEAGTPAEQELLYGLPMEAAAAVGRRAGVVTRVYIPYGNNWIPYSLRQAAKNPATIGRFVTDLVTGHRDGLPPPV